MDTTKRPITRAQLTAMIRALPEQIVQGLAEAQRVAARTPPTATEYRGVTTASVTRGAPPPGPNMRPPSVHDTEVARQRALAATGQATPYHVAYAETAAAVAALMQSGPRSILEGPQPILSGRTPRSAAPTTATQVPGAAPPRDGPRPVSERTPSDMDRRPAHVERAARTPREAADALALGLRHVPYGAPAALAGHRASR